MPQTVSYASSGQVCWIPCHKHALGCATQWFPFVYWGCYIKLVDKAFITQFNAVYRHHLALSKIKSLVYISKNIKKLRYTALMKACEIYSNVRIETYKIFFIYYL